MSVGQKIYHALELFAPQAPHREKFCASLAQALTDNGSAPLAARNIAAVVADALSESADDHHLAMAHIIAFHPPLMAVMDDDLAAVHAMHRYMSYFLDMTEVDTGPQARYAIN